MGRGMIATAPPKARACLTAALFVVLAAAAWTALSQPAAGKAAWDRLSLLALLDTAETSPIIARRGDFFGLAGPARSRGRFLHLVNPA